MVDCHRARHCVAISCGRSPGIRGVDHPCRVAASPGGGGSAPLADVRRPPAPEQGSVQRPTEERSAPATRRASRGWYTDRAAVRPSSLRRTGSRAAPARLQVAGSGAERARDAVRGGQRGEDRPGAGKPALFMESQLPLRTVDDNGAPTPVDLSLRGDASAGFEPLAPLVKLTIDGQADEGLTLHDIGVTVTPVGTDEVAGSRARTRRSSPRRTRTPTSWSRRCPRAWTWARSCARPRARRSTAGASRCRTALAAAERRRRRARSSTTGRDDRQDHRPDRLGRGRPVGQDRSSNTKLKPKTMTGGHLSKFPANSTITV